MPSLLFIDPLNAVPEALLVSLREEGYQVYRAPSVPVALACADVTSVDVAFLGIDPAGGNLVEDLGSLHLSPSKPEVIVLSTHGTPEEAAQAIKGGAWDYLDYPATSQATALVLSRVLHYRSQREFAAPRDAAWKNEGIVGTSPQMRACLDIAAQAAHSDANVLITGETGTGKELIAAAIHANSAREKGNFVVVDCAAIPESLVDTTLLGHEKGAFTGADKAHVGLIKQADGGTLFLDEIGELPLSAQKSFLRVLQEHRFRPVGGKSEVLSNFRIIAASNRNLDEMMHLGEFRKDLLFRIRAFSIELPPLRERREDTAELIRYHLPLLCERMGLQTKDASADFFEIAERYSWPGNVREVINALERSIASARQERMIFAAHLPNYIRIHLAQEAIQQRSEYRSNSDTTSKDQQPGIPPLSTVREAAVDDAERRYLMELMSLTRGDIDHACRISHLSRSRLYALLKKHRLPSSPR
jgi:two-component system, NtrC family, response regulator